MKEYKAILSDESKFPLGLNDAEVRLSCWDNSDIIDEKEHHEWFLGKSKDNIMSYLGSTIQKHSMRLCPL